MSTFLRVSGLVLLVVILLVGLSLLLMKICKERPMAKYIPTFLVWLLSIALYIFGRFFAEPMQDLGYYIMSMIAGVSTFIVLIVTILIDRSEQKKNKK